MAIQKTSTFGPYSTVRRGGDTFYISGQVGVNFDTKTASSSIALQVKQALDNLGAALKSVGLGYDDVVKTTLYLTDITSFSEVNAVYVSYFNESRPARTTIGVADLPHVAGDIKLQVEIDAVAVRKTV